MTPIITVIMPVYNVELYLERSIQSIINQTYNKWELIIINDGSTDNSLEVIKNLANKDKRIKVLNQVNQGAGKARQNGLNHAVGKYICFVDPDDFLAENALENNLVIAEKHRPDLIVNGYLEIKENFGSLVVKEHHTNLSGVLNQDDFRTDFLIKDQRMSRALWNKFYSHEFIKRNHCVFPNQRIGQDALFNYEVYKNVQKIYISNDKYYHYDSSREGSAIKGFRDRRAEYELNIASTYHKLIKDWGREKSYEQMIKEEYWNVVYTELKNLNFSDCKLELSKKKSRLKQLLANTDLKYSIDNIDKTNFNLFNKCLIESIKKNKFFIALGLMKIRMVLGNI